MAIKSFPYALDFIGEYAIVSQLKEPGDGRNLQFVDKNGRILPFKFNLAKNGIDKDGKQSYFVDGFALVCVDDKDVNEDPVFCFIDENGNAVIVGICAPTREECNFEFNTTTSTMTINGNGNMMDYTSTSVPWNGYKTDIHKIKIENGFTLLNERSN